MGDEKVRSRLAWPLEASGRRSWRLGSGAVEKRPSAGPYKPLASQIYGTLRLLAEDREKPSATPVFLNNLRLRRADQE
jgi:hypothetical protein